MTDVDKARKNSPEHQVEMLMVRMVLNQVVIPPGITRCEICDGSGILWPLDPTDPDEVCEYCDGKGIEPKEDGE